MKKNKELNILDIYFVNVVKWLKKNKWKYILKLNNINNIYRNQKLYKKEIDILKWIIHHEYDYEIIYFNDIEK